jgi:hypothetical protein
MQPSRPKILLQPESVRGNGMETLAPSLGHEQQSEERLDSPSLLVLRSKI